MATLSRSTSQTASQAMPPPIIKGEGADISDDESFVSASATSPTVSKGPPPPVGPKRASTGLSSSKPTPKPKPTLGPKPTTAQTIAREPVRNISGPSTRERAATSAPLPAAGPNARIAIQQPPLSVSPASIPLPPASPILAASPSITGAYTPGPALAPSTRLGPAVKPKPTICPAPVSRSHFANNPLPTQEQIQARVGSPNRRPADPSKAVQSERYVTSPPRTTESKRFTTPPPGGWSNNNVVSHRLTGSAGTQPIPISARPQPSRPLSQGRIPSSYDADIYQHQNSIGMSVDSLANAMVAGKLATSAATSRSASMETRPKSTGSMRAPPPLPPARRSGTSLFDKLTPGHSRHGSRAGSPSKDVGKRQMKTTLRKQKTGSDEEEDGRHVRHKKRNLVKKHPNKHHEGDRKRWRDVVTDRERKRYEGLWASNKGICIGEPVRNAARVIDPNESVVSLAGSYATNLSGTYQGGTQGAIPGSTVSLMGGVQAPVLQRVSSYQNPAFSRSQHQNLGMVQGQGPYASSAQNFSTYSLATTSGSNSGGNSSPQPPSRFILPPARAILPPEPLDCVSSLVVRDIWSRSRLPPDVLHEVWDLVDRTGQGMLCKDEFCAGLWLIDQRLKGRKLPQRVSDSVWRSLTGLRGVQIKEFKGRDKVRVVSGGR